MEGYRRICEAINQEHQQMLHCKKQRQRFSMKECQRISECEIPSSLVFYRFFILSVGHIAQHPIETKNLSHLGRSKTDTKRYKCRFRQVVVAGEAPRHRLFRLLKVSDLKKCDEFFDVFHVNKYC